MNYPNYSAKGGAFFEKNAGVAKSPVNAGPGEEKFYQGRVAGLGIPSQSVNMMPNGEYNVTNAVTEGQAGPLGKTAGLSAGQK